MLVNNFSAGILGGILAILAYAVVGPVVSTISELLREGVETIVAIGLIPLVSILVEPAKILFLNNAINHGCIQSLSVFRNRRKSANPIFFMIESNPGPGFGYAACFPAYLAKAWQKAPHLAQQSFTS